MLGKLHILFSSVCTVVLIVPGHAKCPVAQWGAKINEQVVIGPLMIHPYRHEIDVKIPLKNIGCEVVGVSAFTCDSLAELSFVEPLTVRIRRPYGLKTATLYAILYCEPIIGPTRTTPSSWQNGPLSNVNP